MEYQSYIVFSNLHGKSTVVQGVPKKNATPHKMVSICRYMCYIINKLILQYYRQFNFTQLWKVSSSKSWWLLQNSSFTNITQKSLCTGFGWSTIVNANTFAWHLLQMNPFTTKNFSCKTYLYTVKPLLTDTSVNRNPLLIGPAAWPQ